MLEILIYISIKFSNKTIFLVINIFFLNNKLILSKKSRYI